MHNQARKSKSNASEKKEFKNTLLCLKAKTFFLLDCETTGSRRNYDRAIEWCVMAYDSKGRLLDCFESRVHPGSMQVSYHGTLVHGISNKMLQDE